MSLIRAVPGFGSMSDNPCYQKACAGSIVPMKTLSYSRDWCWLAILVIAACDVAWCQGDIQNQLTSQYKNRTFLLRNFYAGNDLKYDQNGVLQDAVKAGPWLLAAVELKTVNLTEHGIEISANRLGTLYEAGKVRLIKTGNMKIRVSGSDLRTDKNAVDSIFSKIFVDPAHEQLDALVPDIWKYYLAGSDLQSRLMAWRSSLQKTAVQPIARDSAPNARDSAPKKISAPRVIHDPDPNYTKEARSHSINGRSLLTTVIDATGNPTQIAILDPLGMGLDEEAVAALQQWRFQPAMLNGKGIAVEIRIEIQFRCCP
jgi:TonB family protein